MANFEGNSLSAANLVIDATYLRSRRNNAGDDVLGPLVGVSNTGGFRILGQLDALRMVALLSSGEDPDWPDAVDPSTGVLTYYGDNNQPGRELHETPRWGNRLLRQMFDDANQGREGRLRVPPTFVFFKSGPNREVRFAGLVVPGVDELTPGEDLVAVWKVTEGLRYQNYRALFTVLDLASVPRQWIEDVRRGQPNLASAPEVWQRWIETGQRRALRAVRSVEYRTKAEQLPQTAEGRAIVQTIYEHFAPKPVQFEYFAAAITKLLLPDVVSLDVTRPTRDGGRDAIGLLRVGTGPGSIQLDFAVEAKCYGGTQTVGVGDMSRLISRLRHRQFGILVTTSAVGEQAYKEIKDDRHPIIILAAADVVAVLRKAGWGDAAAVARWLRTDFAIQ